MMYIQSACWQGFLYISALNIVFVKTICHLSFLMREPFIEADFGHDRCLVTDSLHLSSVIRKPFFAFWRSGRGL